MIFRQGNLKLLSSTHLIIFGLQSVICGLLDMDVFQAKRVSPSEAIKPLCKLYGHYWKLGLHSVIASYQMLMTWEGIPSLLIYCNNNQQQLGNIYSSRLSDYCMSMRRLYFSRLNYKKNRKPVWLSLNFLYELRSFLGQLNVF